jgi:hypothetical protein
MTEREKACACCSLPLVDVAAVFGERKGNLAVDVMWRPSIGIDR